MKRRVLCFVLCALIVAAALPCSALAANEGSYRAGSVCTSIQKAVRTAMLKATVAAANAEIYALVKIAQATPYDDVDRLLAHIDNIANRVFAYADSIGATVVCVYEPYVIDGRTVMIDPLKVINV